MLGVSLNTLDWWLSRGVVPSFKLGRRVFIPRAALMELMQPRVPQPARRPVLSAREAWDADHPHR